MYFIELLFKKLAQKKDKPVSQKISASEQIENEEENCEHIFQPIDSTGKVLVCAKCGLLIRKN